MTDIIDQNYEKFPAIIKEMLDSGISFPKGTRFFYDKFIAYRIVTRAEGDFSSPISDNDFKSYKELGKSIKKKRIIGKNNDDIDETLNSDLYSVSFFLEKEELINYFSMPKPTKRMIQGFIHEESGPQYTNKKGHVSWWLYKQRDISTFTYCN
ncbi:hypothetical protein [Thomasclavelia cocleata]|jgi:hypothetical protein|uniref:hypothetical protein n=1 Tax=Thomasclavelia cocleata TaxID=69824 RepID=UPI002578AB40|nr:hypothetical protein [Thomasclavelia cocleata]